MGPTNVALVKLYRADLALREAQGRLDEATKNVRIQERKVHDLAGKMKDSHTRLRESQAKGGEHELDIKSREARIEKLRTQQQATHSHKEYQAFLMEISTEKLERGKVEDELIKVMELIEKGQKELSDITAQHDSEIAKLSTMRSQIDATVAALNAEVESLRPARLEAWNAIPAKYRSIYDRTSEKYDGEAMSSLSKPDRRREEYLCSGCMMDLVADMYNRLHTRDDAVICTNCGRFLYIPEDLPPEVAINSRGKSESSSASASGGPAAPRAKRAPKVDKLPASERRAKGKIGELLSKAQGVSVETAVGGGAKPIECEVIVDGKVQGVYKGKSAEHLLQVIEFHLNEASMTRQVEVREKAAEQAAASASEPPPAAPAADASASPAPTEPQHS